MSRSQWRRWIALAAAPLLALQLLLAGLAVGAHAAPAKIDFFGNVICSAEGEVVHPDGQAPSHSHLPNCCVLGCGQAGWSALPPPALADAGPTRAASEQPVLYQAADRLAATSSRTPHNARAPPGMI